MELTKSKSILARLLSTIEPNDFFSSYWPNQDFCIHDRLERMSEIGDLPMLKDITTLLSFLESQKRPLVRVWFRTGEIHNSILASPADAKKLYLTGATTIVIDNLHQHVPLIAKLMEDLGGELRTPLKKFACNVYASPVGIGSRMHFDAEENFFFQIRGQKRWRYAPNQHVKNAPAGYMGEKNIPAELKPLCTSFPNEMPADSKTVVLKPGSVLYVPRGYWHESHTVEDSLALTLMFVASTWKDVLFAQLGQMLHIDESWRAPAAGLLSRDESSMKVYRTLIKDLGERLGSSHGWPGVVDDRSK